ncbi:MmgE/PrpD family protein [Sporosarcina sp. FSL W7-1349]|uniref:MmgE/PrpD family protein n=1 Tax=Sporosarcina sp. FSL W7-1349 TaxID=2921561 RepID=UPI0030F796D5
MGYTESLSRFAKNYRFSDSDKSVINQAKLLMLDSFAAIMEGNMKPGEAFRMRLRLSQSVPNKNRFGLILGTEDESDYPTAALINGIAMVSDEMDEGNPLAKGHPACHFLPAFISLGLKHNVSGEDFLSAFIVNYEISARAGASVQAKQEIHPHGNWGVFGNGFGVGRLLGWENEEYYVQASLLSSSYSLPTLWDSVMEGHKVRNSIIGFNNLHTVFIPDLINSGFSASPVTFETIFGKLLGNQADTELLASGLGTDYYLLKSYFKFYSYCRFCHSPIDAVLSIAGDVELDEVSEITIDTYSLAAKLNGTSVANDFAGKFSIPFAVATELLRSKQVNTDSKDGKSQMQRLMGKVKVTENQQFTAMLPSKRVTSAAILLKDGRRLETVAERAKGDVDEPQLHEKVVEKSKRALSPIYGEEKTAQFLDNILRIEEQENLAFLYEMKP